MNGSTDGLPVRGSAWTPGLGVPNLLQETTLIFLRRHHMEAYLRM